MSLASALGAGADADPSAPLRCSRAGCRAEAVTAIDWRNPRIHAADRVKTWLACAEHREFLAEFLRARDFPVALRPLAAPGSR